MFKHIIFDLDNTLYDHGGPHEYALNVVLTKLNELSNVKLSLLREEYERIREVLKYELPQSAASHKRTIYFKAICECFNISLDHLELITDTYWKAFRYAMALNDGVLDVLEFCKSKGIKCYILTDFTLDEQIAKLKTLKVLKYFTRVITSEELGCEKPNSKAFNSCLSIIGCQAAPNEVLMVGDSLEKDILGATRASIFALHYLPNKTNNELNVGLKSGTFSSFRILFEWFKGINESLETLITLSRSWGQRVDAVQYAGGNISVKCGELMFIKSSGTRLVDVDDNNGYTVLNANNEVIYGHRPSMEYPMHSTLKKYVVHLHPIQINTVLVRADARTILEELYPQGLIIDYITPGDDLAKAINTKYSGQQVIFLLNHGVIFTTDDYNELCLLITHVLTIFESHSKIDFKRYWLCQRLSTVVNKYKTDTNRYICYVVDDFVIKSCNKSKVLKLVNTTTFPDSVVYFSKVLELDSNEEQNSLTVKNYIEKKGCIPVLIYVENDLYIIGNSLDKCRGIEELIKTMILLNDQPNIKTLTKKNSSDILSLDAEKYRSSGIK